MELNPYLIFNGNCEEALKFYADSLGGQIEGIMKFAGSPAEQHVPPEWSDKVLHARLVIDGKVIMASDGPGDKYEKPRGISVAIGIDDLQRAERIFNRLAENGTVQMPFQKTFWAKGFGSCTDRFGIPWMVNCE
jgi:PhnB protein